MVQVGVIISWQNVILVLNTVGLLFTSLQVTESYNKLYHGKTCFFGGWTFPFLGYHKNMLVWPAWTGPPAPARKLTLAGTPAQPHFAPLQEQK